MGAGLLSYIDTGQSIFWFSDRRKPFWDFFFTWFTKVGEEPTYFLLAFVFLFVRFRSAALVGAVGIITTIVAFLLKTFFAHDRPILFFEKLGQLDLIQLIDGVHTVTGQTAFPSGHTMSGFALFGFLAFLLKRKKGLALLLFLIAFMVGLSRIYLVQHFLKDVYAGALVGTLIAIVLYLWQAKYPPDPAKRRIDRRFRFKRRG